MREIAALSHGTWRHRLRTQFEDAGAVILVVNESFTSKTCCECGAQNDKLGASRVFRCAAAGCNNEIARDCNGARNIMLRNWSLVKPLMSVGVARADVDAPQRAYTKVAAQRKAQREWRAALRAAVRAESTPKRS